MTFFQEGIMAKKVFLGLFLALAVLGSSWTARVADAKGGYEKVFSEDYDRVWDATVAVVTEMGFSKHPHKKMKTKKSKGRIKTPEWRYFKIWSASPVVQKDYKDSYRIKLKKIEIEVPKPAGAADPKVDGTPPTAAAAPPAAKPAETAAGEKAPEAASPPPPPPVETITKVKVIIKRKFLVHNDETRKWVKGDPKKEKVGFSVEDIVAAIEAKLKEEKPAVDPTRVANRNIVPPPISNGPPPDLK